MIRRLGITVLAGSLVALMGVAAVSASPEKSRRAVPLTIECDNNQTYDAVGVGGGWAPAFVVSSKTKLVPTAFISFEGVYIDPEGNPHPEVQLEPEFKGNGNAAKNRDIMTCTYSIFFENPETGESFSGTGVVEAYLK